jgi:hypothetical protein
MNQGRIGVALGLHWDGIGVPWGLHRGGIGVEPQFNPHSPPIAFYWPELGGVHFDQPEEASENVSIFLLFKKRLELLEIFFEPFLLF